MVQRGSGQESLTAIRSPVLTGAGSCGAFLFLENGVPIRPVGFCNVNEMLEINTEQADAIEVLRGTGTALYGSNSVHGTINVLQDAPPELPPWQLGLGVGPDQYMRGRLVASHQGETTGLGIKALYTHDGGWRDESGFDEGKVNATFDGRRRWPHSIAVRSRGDEARTADGWIHPGQERLPRPGPERDRT